MSKAEAKEYYPASKKEWRKWLEKNHAIEDSVWVIFYKKKVNKPTLTWSDSVDEALCFGWIDSTKKSMDEERFIQYFCKRKAKSTWSKVNKDKILILRALGEMRPAGEACIEIAKTNGSWEILDSVEALILPADLEEKLKLTPGYLEAFLALTKSIKKPFLYRLVSAKRQETREKRMDEVLEFLPKMKPKV